MWLPFSLLRWKDFTILQGQQRAQSTQQKQTQSLSALLQATTVMQVNRGNVISTLSYTTSTLLLSTDRFSSSALISTCISIPCDRFVLQDIWVLLWVFCRRCCFGALGPREFLWDPGNRARLFPTERANACGQAFALDFLLQMGDLVYHTGSQFALGTALLATHLLLQVMQTQKQTHYFEQKMHRRLHICSGLSPLLLPTHS